MQVIIKPNDKPGGTPDLMTGPVKVGQNKTGIYLTNYDANRFYNLLTHIKNSCLGDKGSVSFIEESEFEELIRLLGKAYV